MSNNPLQESQRKFLRGDFFRLMARALQPTRRRILLCGILSLMFITSLLEELHSPVITVLTVVTASGLCIYLGILILSVLPREWKRSLQYRIVAWWLIALGISIPILVVTLEATRLTTR